MPGPAPKVCIACSIFRRELEQFQAEGRTALSMRYLDSMLHMQPERLQERVQALLAEHLARGGDVVLVYGDCCPRMLDYQQLPGVARTAGINCCEILLGRERYRALRREGAFFLMPEWALDWRRAFHDALGPRKETARMLMRDMHTRLVYLDTGLVPAPERELEEIAEYTGLPVERMAVTLDALLAALQDATTGNDDEQA
jgi:hypothetical protein